LTQVVLAIDPGKSGAIALFIGDRLDNVMPATPGALCKRLVAYKHRRVVIEQVNGAPGQSGPASFNFGRAYGELLGVCAALDVEPVLVRPVDWKGGLGLRREYGESVASFKRKSLVMARERWPQHANTFFARAKDDGAAEAALLGHYAIKEGLV